jgi:hypothetical protein
MYVHNYSNPLVIKNSSPQDIFGVEIPKKKEGQR